MLCFRENLVAKNFMDKREGEVSKIPLKNFCLTVPNNAVGKPFSLSLISGVEKVWMRGWGLLRFSVESFLFHSAEKFRRGITTFWCLKTLGIDRKILWQGSDWNPEPID